MPRKPAIKVPVPKAKAAKAPKAQGHSGGTGAGYESTRYTGRRSFLWLSPAQDQRRDLTPAKRHEMLKKLRWGERNSGMVRQIVGDLVLYTVGDGFRAQAHSADPAWNATAEAYFADWSRKCDITGRFSFNDVLRIAERRWVLDGDFFLAKVRNGSGATKLQGIEAHRVGDPETNVPERMHDGILFGAYGEVAAYNIYRSDGSSRLIPANAMMQVYDAEFISGARGLPLLQHSLNDIQDEMEILALEKSAVKDAAEITRVLKKNGGEFGPDLASELASNPQAVDALGVGLGGKFIALEPGEDLRLVPVQPPLADLQRFPRGHPARQSPAESCHTSSRTTPRRLAARWFASWSPRWTGSPAGISRSSSTKSATRPGATSSATPSPAASCPTWTAGRRRPGRPLSA